MDKTIGTQYRRTPTGTLLLERDLKGITEIYLPDDVADEFIREVSDKLYGGSHSNLLSTLIGRGSFDYGLVPIERFTNISEQNHEYQRRMSLLGYLEDKTHGDTSYNPFITNTPVLADDSGFPMKYVSELANIITAMETGLIKNLFGTKTLDTKAMLDLYWILYDFVSGFENDVLLPMMSSVTNLNEEDTRGGLLYLCNKGSEIKIILV